MIKEQIVRLTITDNETKAEVVGEVVRCKGCKYHEDEVPSMVWCPNIVGNWVNDDWFCADGERKETENG